MTDRYELRSIDAGAAAPFAVGEWRGDGQTAGEPVLAIHGISSTHRLWSWTAAHAPGTHIVAPDLRGRGGSFAVGGPYSLAVHADDMIRILDALEIEQAVVAGMSLGGFIAVTLAARAPDRVRALLLVDGGLPMRLPMADLTPEHLPVIMASRLERVRTEWASVTDYKKFFIESMAPLLADDDPLLDASAAYDLGGAAPSLVARLDGEAILQDSADLFFGDTHATSLARLTTPARLLYAEWSADRGTPPAYTAETVAEATAELRSFSARLVPGTDHGSIVMTDAAAAVVAEELTLLTRQ